MTSVPATNGTNPAASGGSTSSNAIAGNFDQFLLLLTTQLRNQNPLDPLDTNQFTQQLVQFASVEQQLNTNSTLTQLLAATRSSNIASGLNYVGATVTVDGATSQLADGSATWQVTAPRAAAKAIVTITDGNGNIVQTISQPLNAGAQTFTWNGGTATGGIANEGAYTIHIDAMDASGQLMTVSTDATGVVDSVDVSGATPMLNIGGMTFSAEKVKTISRFS